jgi:Winged helix-turn helix
MTEVLLTKHHHVIEVVPPDGSDQPLRESIIKSSRRPPKTDPKQRSLEESGTANPHAQDVRDPAFTDSDFFDPRDLVQVKYEMLRRVQTQGQSVAKASALFGVSRPSFYKAKSDFDRSGLVGLRPAKRGPRGPRKITPRFIEQNGRPRRGAGRPPG